MLSSSVVPRSENHVVSFKTPGTKRRAFGDISNRKPAAAPNGKPQIAKVTKQSNKKPLKRDITTKTAVDNDDDILEFPAGRMSKDLDTDEWFWGDVFDEIERQDKEFDDAVKLEQAMIKKEEMERRDLYKKELYMECQRDAELDASILRKDFEKYCAFSFDDDDDSIESDSCDELEWPVVEI